MSIRRRIAERLQRASRRAQASRDRHRPPVPNLEPLRWARALVPEEDLERVDTMQFHDRGHGYDDFGLCRDGIVAGMAITEFAYRRWFRVQAHGRDHVPTEGPTLIAANHSGALPIDGMMVWADLARKSPGMRVPRVIVDHFVGGLPVVAEIFIKGGAIGGARGNLHELLSRGEMVIVFPEGVSGVGKRFKDRYQLQRWTEGHAELAIRHGAKVVPTAVIGAEEAMPMLGRIDGIHVMGIPHLPIPATILPFPVRYHLWYGEPIDMGALFPRESATNPDAVAEAAMLTHTAVDALLKKGLAARQGLFQ